MSEWLAWAAQVAAVARWKAQVAPVGGRVFDGAAPRDEEGRLPATPYIVVGEKTAKPVRTLGASGASATLTAHVWSAYPGNKEAEDVVRLMVAAMREPLALTGHGSARLKWEFATVIEDPSGMRHAPVRFRVIALQHAAQ